MANVAADPLLLVPGLLCSERLFAPQIAAFGMTAGGTRREIVVADHTRSDRMEQIAADILKTAPPRFALAGLSMGGYIAMAIFRAAPERVTRIAFLDTTARPDPPERAADRRRLVEIARAEGVSKVQGILLPRLIHPSRMSDRPLVDVTLAMADDVGVEAFARQQEAIIARPDSRPTLTQITVPALVVVGEQDLQTPPDVAREMANAIAGSTLVVIPDCGHLSTLERPEVVNAAMRDWLTR